MGKAAKAADFLSALNTSLDDEAPAARLGRTTPAAKPSAAPAKAGSRAGLKHLGGYFDREMVEKFAILRARLGKDNSELMAHAIEELYRRETAKRAFGDS